MGNLYIIVLVALLGSTHCYKDDDFYIDGGSGDAELEGSGSRIGPYNATYDNYEDFVTDDEDYGDEEFSMGSGYGSIATPDQEEDEEDDIGTEGEDDIYTRHDSDNSPGEEEDFVEERYGEDVNEDEVIREEENRRKSETAIEVEHSSSDPDLREEEEEEEVSRRPSNKMNTDVQIIEHDKDAREISVFAQPGMLAAFIGGVVMALLLAILLVMFIVYRMRKKDEGSYPLDEPKRVPLTSSYSPNDKEIYA